MDSGIANVILFLYKECAKPWWGVEGWAEGKEGSEYMIKQTTSDSSLVHSKLF